MKKIAMLLCMVCVVPHIVCMKKTEQTFKECDFARYKRRIKARVDSLAYVDSATYPALKQVVQLLIQDWSRVCAKCESGLEKQERGLLREIIKKAEAEIELYKEILKKLEHKKTLSQ